MVFLRQSIMIKKILKYLKEAFWFEILVLILAWAALHEHSKVLKNSEKISILQQQCLTQKVLNNG